MLQEQAGASYARSMRVSTRAAVEMFCVKVSTASVLASKQSLLEWTHKEHTLNSNVSY